jgi:hypothetical protein
MWREARSQWKLRTTREQIPKEGRLVSKIEQPECPIHHQYDECDYEWASEYTRAGSGKRLPWGAGWLDVVRGAETIDWKLSEVHDVLFVDDETRAAVAALPPTLDEFLKQLVTVDGPEAVVSNDAAQLAAVRAELAVATERWKCVAARLSIATQRAAFFADQLGEKDHRIAELERELGRRHMAARGKR